MMNFITIDNNGYNVNNINELGLNNLEFASLNFNIIQDELELFPDDIIIKENNITLYRCNCIICSINVSDVNITRVVSTIPLNKEVNGLLLNELRYEYIISFKQLNKNTNNYKLKHMYLRSRTVLDYIFIKK